jgi:magnesium-transporting ATPase (P-type)
MAEGVLYNCSARLEKNEKGEVTAVGNVTEQGLLRCLLDLNVDCMNTLLNKDPHILHIIPFNSSRKMASTLIRHPKNSNIVRAFCKGAPEYVLSNVYNMFDKNGKVVKIDESQKEAIKRKIVGDTFAVQAYRTLLIAYADYSYDDYIKMKDSNNGFATESDREALEQGLTMIGIYAL